MWLSKLRGGVKSPSRVAWAEIFWASLGSFLGIGAIGFINYRFFEDYDLFLMLGSFGASAVLIYGSVRSPMAQPRNLVGDHLLSAVIGVAAFKLIPHEVFLAAPFAVAFAVIAMHATRTLHPPGGATALTAVVGSDKIHSLGFTYVVWPVALGALVLLAVGLFINNLSPNRKYPEFWY